MPRYTRSEEHTSELQSQSNLVCRLLLEKKKPGLRTKLPFGVETVRKVKVQRVFKAEFGFRTEDPGVRTRFSQRSFAEESLMLTRHLNAAQQEQARTPNEGVQFFSQEVHRERGQGERTLAKAEGYAINRTNTPKGDVASFNALLTYFFFLKEPPPPSLSLLPLRDPLPT